MEQEFVETCLKCSSNDNTVRNEAFKKLEQFQQNDKALSVCFQIIQSSQSPVVSIFHALRFNDCSLDVFDVVGTFLNF